MTNPLCRYFLVLIFPLAAHYAQAESTTPSAVSDMVALAVQHENAEGVPRDYLRAASLYCSAARTGNVDALYGLGWMIANGRGMSVDEHVAARLFKMAAVGGHVHATALMQRISASDDASLPACLASDPEKIAVVAPAPDEESTAVRDLRNVSGARIHQLVVKLAPRYQIDPNLAMAIIYIESGFNVNARSPKNAQGLMQLMPDTAQRFKVKNAFDAEDNIKGGLAYLRWLLAYFEGDVALVAAAYNAGEGAVERYRGVPPYAETKAYVAKLAKLYRPAEHRYDNAIGSTSSIFKLAKSRLISALKLTK
ncbi:MAG: transglycosylase SLT domain-containing protein [Herminiimonas sp.]|nr:transglycosylase SLT domain-containing protein [Herminiimonas sp.]